VLGVAGYFVGWNTVEKNFSSKYCGFTFIYLYILFYLYIFMAERLAEIREKSADIANRVVAKRLQKNPSIGA
jgi:hypothetical protein